MKFIRLLSASLVLAFLFVLPARGSDVPDVVTAPQTLAACAVADATTTAYAVSTGLGVEKNPILAPSVNAHHFGAMILTKLALVGLVWWIAKTMMEPQSEATAIGAANVVTCGVAAHNAWIILK